MFRSVRYLDGDKEETDDIVRPGKVFAVFQNGDTFEGEYESTEKGFKRTGLGTYVWHSKAKYEGEYVQGKRVGHGKYTFPSGEIYEGEWADGVKSGKGQYTYTNGDVFYGTWAGDKRNGKGRFINQGEKLEITGTWKDGHLKENTISRKELTKVEKPEIEKTEAKESVAEPKNIEKDEPAAEDPTAAPEEPAVEKPVAEEPVAEEPVAEEPVAEEPAAEEPTAEEPAAEEPAAEEPVAEEPTAEEPVVEEPTAEEPAAEEPVAEEPTATEPAAEEPATETNVLDEQEQNAEDATQAVGTAAVGATATAAEETAAEGAKPMFVVIAGPPASGKGTQCKGIVEDFGLVHVSTGDLLRAAKKEGTELGNQAAVFMEKGELVPDELVNELLKERLEKEDCKKRGVLLDGYPRTGAQAELLKSMGVEVDACLLLEVPNDVVIKRACGRRLDPETGDIYHVDFNPPPEEIASRMTIRKDDNEESMQERLALYADNIETLKAAYEKQLRPIDGNKAPSEVSSDVKEILVDLEKKSAESTEETEA